MNAHSRVLLLAELFGANVDKYIFHTLQSIEGSEQYQTLLKNVEKAKAYNVPYSETFLKLYDDMKFSRISTFRDALIAQATINHLSYISNPRYFINPLLYNSNEMSSSIRYLEELPCFASSRELSIEEMIKSDNISYQEKIKVIDNVCATYRNNAKEVIIDKINDLASKNEIVIKNKRKTNNFFWTELSLCIILNIYLIFTLFSQENIIKTIRLSSDITITGITYIIFFALLFVYEAVALINYFAEYHEKSEKLYCYRYLIRNKRKAFYYLEDGIEKIQRTLIENIKNKDNYKKTSLNKYNYLKNYRRILLYLEKETPKQKWNANKPFFYIKIAILTLLIISFIFLLILTIIAISSGRIL